jgi:hypothetical protein
LDLGPLRGKNGLPRSCARGKSAAAARVSEIRVPRAGARSGLRAGEAAAAARGQIHAPASPRVPRAPIQRRGNSGAVPFSGCNPFHFHRFSTSRCSLACSPSAPSSTPPSCPPTLLACAFACLLHFALLLLW